MNNNTPIPDDTPKKVELTCSVTGKKTTWLNRQCIAREIAKHGSLAAWQAQYVSRGAKPGKSIAANLTKAPIIKSICTEGVALGKLTPEEYAEKYRTRVYGPDKDGVTCTVVEPIPVAAVYAADKPIAGASKKSWRGKLLQQGQEASTA